MPDVILVDWRMPKMDGLEFVGRLRRMPGGDAKVLYCAVEGDAGHVARAKRAGVDDYIMKPFDAEPVPKNDREWIAVSANGSG